MRQTEVKRAIQLEKAGLTRAAIARVLGVNASYVSKVLISNGHVKSPINQSAARLFHESDARERAMLRLYRQGLCDQRIAEGAKASSFTVAYWRKRSGLPLLFGGHRDTRRPHKLEAEIIKGFSRGLSYSAIGRRLGITKNVVAGALDRARKNGRVEARA